MKGDRVLLTARAGPIPVTQETRAKIEELSRRANVPLTQLMRICLTAGMQSVERQINEKEQVK